MDRETLIRMFSDIFTTCVALSEEDMAHYADLALAGQEPDKQLPEIGAHLDECPDCAGRYAELLALLQVEVRDKVPPLSYSHSFDLRFLPTPEAGPLESTPGLDLLERLRQAKGVIEATVLPPLRLRPMPLRGPTAPAMERFRAKGAGIDVHISVLESHRRGARTVMGRLVPHDETSQPTPGLEVWLMQGKEARAAPLEAGGVFTFEEVEPGEYSIGLEWNAQAVLVREVRVT